MKPRREEEKKSKKERKKERKEKEEKEEKEKSKARGSAASARQSSSFNPSKGRMGGSTSEDEEKGELHRLEALGSVPRSQEGLQGENWTRVDLIVDSGASDSSLPIGVLPGGQRIQRVFHGRWTYPIGNKEVANGISVWTCHDCTFSAVDRATKLR